MNNLPPDVEQSFTHLGQRLALLLANANLPEDVKTAWASLIPEMSLEQLDRLAAILADSLTNASENEFKEFVSAIEQAKATQAQQLKLAENKALKELEEIEAMLHDQS